MNAINCTEINETVGLIAGGGLLPVEFVTHAKNNETVGLIAGGGLLPVEFVTHAKNIGIKKIIAVGFENCTSQDVINNVSIYEQIGVL